MLLIFGDGNVDPIKEFGMDANRLTKGLFSFAAPAMVMSAVLVVAAQPAAIASPTFITLVADSQTGLTSAQIQKLRRRAMGPKGFEGAISPAVTRALGLGEHDRAIYFRSFSMRNPTTGIGYQPHVLPNEAGYLISHWDGKTNTIFRLDAQMNFVASTGSGCGGDPVYPLPQDQVYRILEAELSTWRMIADSIKD